MMLNIQVNKFLIHVGTKGINVVYIYMIDQVKNKALDQKLLDKSHDDDDTSRAYLSRCMRKPTMWFSNRSNKNRSGQSQKDG